ncbi:MAG: DUF2071 domain-containing protein [Pirellulaceae bacterium]|nr:DUF2071 domain-containing protein [Pirellulaceae bacterium]
MHIPIIRGVIERRILVNYRVDPEVLARILPSPFRPKQVRGVGLAGICLIRLSGIRPRFLPAVLGLRSENAAHRMAVEWLDDGEQREGVYIPRRDTSSRLNWLAGGRLFPGLQHHARFQVQEELDRYQVQLDSDDGRTHVLVRGRVAPRLPANSVFRSLNEASEFFRRGSLGYSDAAVHGEYDGMELRTSDWHCQALDVERVESSFFEDAARFPPGSCQFDCALLMRGIEHEWCERPMLCCEAAAG